MKESEFIELLNLYLDHEISAADAARLEAEVKTNPARRRVYQEYCRMQKACKIVVADFQADAAIAAATGDRKVVAFEPSAMAAASDRRSRLNTFYTVGTFAAVAACVAIIFVGRSRQQPSGSEQGTIVQVAPASTDAKPALAAADTPTPRLVAVPKAPSTMVSNPLLLGNAPSDAVFTSAPDGNQLEWINALHLAPLPQRVAADQIHFDVHPKTLQPEGRALGGRSTSPKGQQPGDYRGQQPEEYIGFQIIK